MSSPSAEPAIELLTRARTYLLSYITQLEERKRSYCGGGRGCVKDLEYAIRYLGGPEFETHGNGIIMPTHDVEQ